MLVEARRIGDRAVLYVEDRGIGVSADQLADLNERLATPPIVDVAVSRMMGLVVVARLAYRHGVKVELRPAAERGTIADVLLPTSVLVPRSLVGRSTGGDAVDVGAARARADAPAAAGRAHDAGHPAAIAVQPAACPRERPVRRTLSRGSLQRCRFGRSRAASVASPPTRRLSASTGDVLRRAVQRPARQRCRVGPTSPASEMLRLETTVSGFAAA